MYFLFAVVPIKVHTQISFSLPVSSNYIVDIEDRHEMFSMLLVDIFDTEIIHAEGKGD